jgi:membrane fusion protein (multidrug efflux system)
VEFPNPATLFRPGAYAEVTLDLGTDRGAMVVPQTAVFARQTELFVWRVKADMTVESVLVSVRTRAKDMLVIESGIAIGDRIVTEGIQKLRVGSKVAEAPASTHFTPTTSATGSTTAPAAAAPTAATAPTGKK